MKYCIIDFCIKQQTRPIMNQAIVNDVLKSHSPMQPLAFDVASKHTSTAMVGRVQFIHAEDALSESFELIKILRQHQTLIVGLL